MQSFVCLLTVVLLQCLASKASVIDLFKDFKKPKLFVSLGDSFATGNPNGPIALGPDPACLQHEGSYAFMFANDPNTRPNDYRLLACDDQSLTDAKLQQMPRIPRNADLVSITAGSGDVYLEDIVWKCDVQASGNLWFWCNEALDVAEQRTGHDENRKSYDIASNLVALAADDLVLSVRAQAPNALIVLLGYPRFLGSPVVDCITHDRASRATQSQKDRINQLMLDINQALQQASRFDRNIVFKSPDEGFSGHRYCDAESWFIRWNQAQTFEGGYYHPSLQGQKLYQQLLTEAWKERQERDL